MKINNSIVEAFKNCNNVAIFVHSSPDGDCLGSASALKQALLLLGKKADIYSDDFVSPNYMFIKHISEVKSSDVEDGYDLNVMVDGSDFHRIGKYQEYFKNAKNRVCIDHHKTSSTVAEHQHVELVSSAALIMYFYILELVEINKDIACALYAGISADTGCFLHSNTTSLEHVVAAKLIEFGFDLDNANLNLFKYTSMQKFELTKIAFANTRFYYDNKVGIAKLSKQDFLAANATENETAGIVNQIVNVNTALVGIIVSEKKEGICACSFRSKGSYDVSKLAAVFGGGGHANAAGAHIFGTCNTVVKKILDAIKSLGKI